MTAPALELAALIADQLPEGAAATTAHLQRMGPDTVDSLDARRSAPSRLEPPASE